MYGRACGYDAQAAPGLQVFHGQMLAMWDEGVPIHQGCEHLAARLCYSREDYWDWVLRVPTLRRKLERKSGTAIVYDAATRRGAYYDSTRRGRYNYNGEYYEYEQDPEEAEYLRVWRLGNGHADPALSRRQSRVGRKPRMLSLDELMADLGARLAEPERPSRNYTIAAFVCDSCAPPPALPQGW